MEVRLFAIRSFVGMLIPCCCLGIGGLAMAYALAKSGHGVKVFEKSNGSPTVRAPFCPKAKVLVILLTAN